MVIKNYDNLKKIVLVILEGSVSDHLLITPLLRNLRYKYPSDEYYIILKAAYPEVFGYENFNSTIGNFICVNPYINALHPTTIEVGHKADITYNKNPYKESPQKFGPMHLTKVWCDLYAIPFDDVIIDYYYTKNEDLKAQEFIRQFDNPVVIIQPYTDDTSLGNKNWDDKKWQEVITWLVNRGYDVIQIGKSEEHIFNNISHLIEINNIREIATIIKHANFFISIDSFVMHLAKAFNKLGIVLWGRTNPFRTGYIENYNLFKLHSCPELFCGRLESTLIDATLYQPYFTPWECPHRNCMKAIQLQDVCKGVGFIEKALNLDPALFIR